MLKRLYTWLKGIDTAFTGEVYTPAQLRVPCPPAWLPADSTRPVVVDYGSAPAWERLNDESDTFVLKTVQGENLSEWDVSANPAELKVPSSVAKIFTPAEVQALGGYGLNPIACLPYKSMWSKNYSAATMCKALPGGLGKRRLDDLVAALNAANGRGKKTTPTRRAKRNKPQSSVK